MSAGEEDIPKCDLPAKKKPARSPKARASSKSDKKPTRKPARRKPARRKPAAKPAADPAPAWDAKAEAAAAKASALAKQKKAAGPIEAPEGAIVIPGVSKRVRKKPEPPEGVKPHVETAAEKRERAKALREEVRKEEEEAAKAAEKRAREEVARVRAKADRVMNEEVFLDMLLLHADGLTLRQICRMPGMPSRMSFNNYVNCEDEEEAARRIGRLARARELAMDEIADEVVDIVDDGSNDWIERETDGITHYELDREHISRSKLRAETRLKLLAVWDSARYGNKVRHEDADGKPLRGAGMTAGDLAIGLAKLVEAARRNDLSLGEGVIIDQEPREA